MPANIAVICIIRNTAKVIPINSAENLGLSFTRSLKPMRKMPLYFKMRYLSEMMIENCSSHLLQLFLADIDIHQLPQINRRILFLEPENHRQHPQINFLLALVR